LTANRSKHPTKPERAATTRAKKIKGRKRHVAADILGLVRAIMITPAAVADRDAAKTLIKDLVDLFGRLQIIWADGSYLENLVRWVKRLNSFVPMASSSWESCDVAIKSKALKFYPNAGFWNEPLAGSSDRGDCDATTKSASIIGKRCCGFA
jgi:hypothetical protein